MSGELYQLDNVNSRQSISKEKKAFDLALTQIGATNYLWDPAESK
jgi:hypothetical protein